MAESIPSVTVAWSIRSSTSPSLPSRLSPFPLCLLLESNRRRNNNNSNSSTRGRIRCEAQTIPNQIRRKRNIYEIENLTTWLLKHEQSGDIDAELTTVLSSISLACKQIASLIQRSSIINLTGAQGTINVQGEDQKKLDVISNEVGWFSSNTSFFLFFLQSNVLCTLIWINTDIPPAICNETYIVILQLPEIQWADRHYCVRGGGRTGSSGGNELWKLHCRI